jgi:hypothetical protein
MTEPTTTRGTDANSVRKVVSVQAPLAVAWRVFTEKMGTWWPLAYYKIGKANAVDALIEPRVGGRWYERGDVGKHVSVGQRSRVGTALATGPLMGYQRRLAV